MTMQTYKPINGWIVVSHAQKKKKEPGVFDMELTKKSENQFRFTEAIVEMVGDAVGISVGDTVFIDRVNCFDVIIEGEKKQLIQLKTVAMIVPRLDH